jgi:2-isopropylmalate synthase
VRSGDDIYSGHAAHTDIIVASTKAYVNALNKLIMDKQGLSGRKESADLDGSV